MLSLLITKNLKDSIQLKEKLIDLPIEIQCSPIVALKPLTYSTPQKSYDCYIFISKNSIRFAVDFINQKKTDLQSKTHLNDWKTFF